MNFDIQSHGFSITAALADYTVRRLRFVLTHHGDRIRRIVVRMGDINGPRGGIDKFCRIRVYLSNAPMAAIGEVGSEMYAAINRAADRIGRGVAKQLERSRIGRRSGRGDAAAATALPDEIEAEIHTTHATRLKGERA